jgi:hypothetical protein
LPLPGRFLRLLNQVASALSMTERTRSLCDTEQRYCEKLTGSSGMAAYKIPCHEKRFRIA